MSLEALDLKKEFIRETRTSNRFAAVDGISLTLEKGQVTVIMGRSGSGKTTLMNMLCGLLAPTSGKVRLDGEDIYALSDSRLSKLRGSRMGVIPQGQTALGSLNVLQNVLLPCTLSRQEGDEARARELLEHLGIAELAGAMPAELSGGELRRMSIARALMRSPKYIFADEPTADLDDENTALVLGFLKETAAEGASVLIITHENEAAAYADRVLTVKSGRISD